MLKRIDLRGSDKIARGLLPRASFDVSSALETIRPLLQAIAEHGAQAIKDVTAQRDGVELAQLRVPATEIDSATASLDPELKAALLESIRRVRAVHRAQLPSENVTEVVPGGVVTQRYLPVERVGVYVPGGLAALASSVIMNVVPAQLAGVTDIAVSSPPQRDSGRPDDTILAVCGLLGISEVYAVGGPAAIGMFAYGTDECIPVDMITGPGNIYVTAAKRAVRSVVGIDAEAGTTEIAILADEHANYKHVAADLISQAEHDPEAASVLVTPSAQLVDRVVEEVRLQVDNAKHSQRITVALSGPQSGIVLVDDIEQGLRVVNAYAAEHLEIQTQNARELALRVRNAGAIFVGDYSPVSLGDYCAGSNHILPTAGSARYSAGLSVHSFLRAIPIIDYGERALTDVVPHVIALAQAENLPAHAAALTVRFPNE